MTTTLTQPRPHAGPPAKAPEPPLVWRRIGYEVLRGARNMALDEALARGLGGGEALLRLYGWTRPTISLGRNEPTALYPVESFRAEGFDVVRRPTGGRAVLHDQELTYAIVAPLGAWGGVREAYTRIHEALAAALRALGAPAEVVRGGRALGPGAGPCFQAPAPGEVVAHGRKLVGSAQARIGRALLQHGSILLAGDQGPLESGTAGSSSPITLREIVGDVSIDEVAGVVADSFRGGLGGRWTDGAVTPSELALADELEAGRYVLDSWTHRR
jgi:lipoate-protein ligase A